MVELFLSPPAEPSPARDLRYSVGVRSRDLNLELSWIASVLGGRSAYPFLEAPPRRGAVAAALRLFDPRDGFDVLAVRDPIPGLAELFNIAAKLPRHLAAAVKPSSFRATPRPETGAQSR
jgi:hypothetical protein